MRSVNAFIKCYSHVFEKDMFVLDTRKKWLLCVCGNIKTTVKWQNAWKSSKISSNKGAIIQIDPKNKLHGHWIITIVNKKRNIISSILIKTWKMLNCSKFMNRATTFFPIFPLLLRQVKAIERSDFFCINFLRFECSF